MNEKDIKFIRNDISLMRLLSTIAVILLHTCNTLSNNCEIFKLNTKQYLFFSSLNYSLNWAVPLFFMISGVFLLDEKREIKYEKIFMRYIKRIVLALFIFGIPFSMLEIISTEKEITFLIPIKAILNVLEGNSWDHLWYLYSLMGIYLILPILRTVIKAVPHNNLIIFMKIVLVMNFVLPFIEQITNVKIAFKLPISGFSVFYLFLGKLLDDKLPRYVKDKKKNLVVIFFTIIGIVFIDYIFMPHGEKLFTYNSPIIVILSVMIFSTLRGIQIRKSIWKVDRLCFGVYLIHPLFINFSYKFMKVTPISFGPLYMFGTIIFLLVFTGLSFGVSFMLYKIQVFRRYLL